MVVRLAQSSRWIAARALHLLKALRLIVASALPALIVTVAKEVQLEKASVSMVVMPTGIVTAVRALHALKASQPIAPVAVEGILIAVRHWQL